MSRTQKQIYISRDIHKQIKILVAVHGTSINKWVEAALKNRLDTGFFNYEGDKETDKNSLLHSPVHEKYIGERKV